VLNIIVVAVDGTDLSLAVISTLASLKIAPEGKIVLAHVIPLPDDLESADRPHKPELLSFEEAEKQLENYKTRLPYPCELEVVTGDAAIELVRLAHIYKADLIVIGSRGLRGVKRIIAGSVSSQVIAEAPCSVLVVRPK
jgi:nucleotide-binding universal stress UspA family protein